MDTKIIQSVIDEIKNRFDNTVLDISYRRSGEEVVIQFDNGLRFSVLGKKLSLSQRDEIGHTLYIDKSDSWLDFLEQLESQFPATKEHLVLMGENEGCVECGEHNILWGTPTSEDDYVLKVNQCADCGTKWHECFDISYVEIVE